MRFIPYQLCPMCEGDGEVFMDDWVVCPICHGRRIIPMYVDYSDEDFEPQLTITGEIQVNLC